jgi:hypothetical protein
MPQHLNLPCPLFFLWRLDLPKCGGSNLARVHSPGDLGGWLNCRGGVNLQVTVAPTDSQPANPLASQTLPYQFLLASSCTSPQYLSWLVQFISRTYGHLSKDA